MGAQYAQNARLLAMFKENAEKLIIQKNYTRPKTRSVKPNQNNHNQTPNSDSESELDSHLEEASVNALTANYQSRQGRPGRPGRGSPSPSGKQAQPEGV